MNCIKKAVEIKALKFTEKNIDAISKFLGDKGVVSRIEPPWDKADGIEKLWFNIHTLEGDVKAYPGDYIIKGVNGEFYPCSEEKFKQLYTKVKGDTYKKEAIKTACIQFTGENAMDVIAFCNDYGCPLPGTSGDTLIFSTGRDFLVASPNDYIIVGIDNIAYPCKPDVFEKTYELGLPEWLENLIDEQSELDLKINKLRKYLVDKENEEAFKNAPDLYIMLVGQLGAMQSYNSFLIQRQMYYAKIEKSLEELKEKEEKMKNEKK